MRTYPDGEGTGVGDDTAAVKAAIEIALGLDSGALDLDQGDANQNPSGRLHREIGISGIHRLTSPIVLRYHRVQIVGTPSGLHGSQGYEGPTLIVDHDGPAFVIDMGYAGAGHLSLSGVRIRRSATQHRSGPAIRIQGANWGDGLTLTGCLLDQHSAAVEIDSEYGNAAFCRLQLQSTRIVDCDTPIAANGTELSFASIRDSTIAGNAEGLSAPFRSAVIDGLDIEGQPDGLHLAPTSRDVDVRGVWSESNTGAASVLLEQCVGGSFGRVHNESGLPDVCLNTARNVDAPQCSAQLITASNCLVRGITLTDDTAETIGLLAADLQYPLGLERLAAPAFGGTAFSDGNWDTPTYYGNVQLNGRVVGTEGSEAGSVTATITHAVASGGNALVGFAVRYANAVTANRCTVSVELHESGGDWQAAQTRAVVLTDSSLPAGHTVQYLALAKSAVAADQIRVTVYPYGQVTDTGWGAVLSPIAAASVGRDDLVPQLHAPTWIGGL